MSLGILLRPIAVALQLVPRVVAALPASAATRSTLPLARALSAGFERLGPAFIKLGQLLSVRPDLAGEEFAAQFSRLRDAAAPLPASTIKEVIRSELKLPVEELFASLDPEPVASGSIAQVHRAVTTEGAVLALKIQRPGAEALLATDLAMLKTLALVAAAFPPIKRHLDLPALAAEVAEAAARETDFLLEARICERFALNFLGVEGLKIPRVHWAYTTRKILAMEYVAGAPIDSGRWRTSTGYRDLAEEGSRYFFMQVLEHGLFHADLHPSNIFITEDGRIAYLDFGIWGELSEGERGAVLGTLAALLARDGAAALENLAALGVRIDPGNRESFALAIGKTLSNALGPDLASTSAARIGSGILEAVRANGVGLPHKYALLIKALLTIEGAARTLHPGFDMEGAARRYLAERFAPRLGVSLPLEIAWRALVKSEITCKRARGLL